MSKAAPTGDWIPSQSGFPLVALSQVKDNTGAALRPSADRLRPSLPKIEKRITNRDRARMVELYENGMDSRSVANELGVAKSTVLRTLRSRGVAIRPAHLKYQR